MALRHAGEWVDGHQLVRRVGGGSRAEVWEATGPEGRVALKVAREDWDRPRLRKEAVLLGCLDIPGLVGLVAGAPDGRWFSMPLVAGAALRDWAAAAPHADRLALLRALARTLAQLHEHGVFHGDLKPDNLRVGADGRPVLLDLGLAVEPPAARREGFHGSLGWAAPEQLGGAAPAAPSDVHGLGLLAWLVLGCGAPFPEARGAAAVWAPRHAVPPHPRRACPALRPDQAALLRQMIAPLPAARPPLSAVIQTLQGPASSAPPPGRIRLRDALRERLAAALAGQPQAVLVEEVDDAAPLIAIGAELGAWAAGTGCDAPVVVAPATGSLVAPPAGLWIGLAPAEWRGPVGPGVHRLRWGPVGLARRVARLVAAEGASVRDDLEALAHRLGVGALDLADALDLVDAPGLVDAPELTQAAGVGAAGPPVPARDGG